MSCYFPSWTKYVNTKELAELFREDLILRAPSAGGERWQISRALQNEGDVVITMILPFISELNLLLDTQAIKPSGLVYKLSGFPTKD